MRLWSAHPSCSRANVQPISNLLEQKGSVACCTSCGLPRWEIVSRNEVCWVCCSCFHWSANSRHESQGKKSKRVQGSISLHTKPGPRHTCDIKQQKGSKKRPSELKYFSFSIPLRCDLFDFGCLCAFRGSRNEVTGTFVQDSEDYLQMQAIKKHYSRG